MGGSCMTNACPTRGVPEEPVFPKDGVARKTVLAKRRGQESLRTMMPPSPPAAHGRVAFSARRVVSFFARHVGPNRRRHADGTLRA
jgi:hypothetical protein